MFEGLEQYARAIASKLSFSNLRYIHKTKNDYTSERFCRSISVRLQFERSGAVLRLQLEDFDPIMDAELFSVLYNHFVFSGFDRGYLYDLFMTNPEETSVQLYDVKDMEGRYYLKTDHGIKIFRKLKPLFKYDDQEGFHDNLLRQLLQDVRKAARREAELCRP